MKVSYLFESFRIKMHIGIATVFIVIVALLSASIVWSNHREAARAAHLTAERLFQQIARETEQRVDGAFLSVKDSVRTLAAMPSFVVPPESDWLAHPAIEAMIRLVEAKPKNIYSAFAAYESGHWLQVIPVHDLEASSATYGTPDGAEFVIRTIRSSGLGARREHLRFIDSKRQTIGESEIPEPTYDHRNRGWYNDTMASTGGHITEPYIFFASRQPGITFATKTLEGRGVVGMDATLEGISEFLSAINASPNIKTFIFDDDGHVLAHHDVDKLSRIEYASNNLKSNANKVISIDEMSDPIVQSIARAANRAEDGRIDMEQMTIDGVTYLVYVEQVGERLQLGHHVAIAAPIADFTGYIRKMQRNTVIQAGLALCLALPIIYFIALRIGSRLRALANEAERIQHLDVKGDFQLKTFFREVHELADAFSSMRSAVAAFGRYVPKELVMDILASGGSDKLTGQRQQITVMFTDISDFSRIAERTDAEDLVARISIYFDEMGSALSEHHGVVDKYIGDAVMALWNAPSKDDDHVFHACAAALSCRKVSRSLASDWSQKGITPFFTRFGLHTGEAVVGNVGGADRLNFTALGPAINLAARLEALNKVYGTEILISGSVARAVEELFEIRWIDKVRPKGLSTPVDIYTLDSFASLRSGDEHSHDLTSRWHKALVAYTKRDWESCAKEFEVIAADFPDDKPAQRMAKRCRTFALSPPDSGWDGVAEMAEK